MYQTRPDDYTAFRCLAGACPQTCCAAWEIVVDPDAQDAYLRLQHPLAAKLRRVLRVDSEGDTYFAQTDGRCPFLCADGLCELQRTLGEQSLCRTCRDFPRWEVLLCDRVEQGLSPACPEAARRLKVERFGEKAEELFRKISRPEHRSSSKSWFGAEQGESEASPAH